MSRWFVIYNFYEADLKIRTDQLINHIQNFNNEHKVHLHNVTQYNIPEEESYISCISPTGFINNQDE